jgi:hypothetical protein
LLRITRWLRIIFSSDRAALKKKIEEDAAAAAE